MKKLYLYLLMTFILFNISISNVKAIDSNSCVGKDKACAVCIYEGSTFEVRFLVESNGKEVSYTYEGIKSKQSDAYGFQYNTKVEDFIDGDKVKCPSDLKYTFVTKNQDRYSTVHLGFETGTSKIMLSNNSTNNYAYITTSTVQSSSTSTSSSTTTSSPTSTASTTQSTSTSSDTTTSTSSSSKSTTPKYVDGTKVEGCEVLGDSFLKYLKSILFWLQIFVPILALVLTMLDFVKAVYAADEDAKKKAVKGTKTRIAAAVIIELLPAFIIVLFSIADFANGTQCVKQFMAN